MGQCYINGIGSIGIQEPSFDVFEQTPTPIQFCNKALHPSYKELIPPAMIRRMASGVKMGVFAANQALLDAQIQSPEAVIVGTGLGCLQDSEKFLNALIENGEEFLTPTSFIQSTHNTVSAQIALHFGCKGRNISYVNGASSFESALLDGLLQATIYDTDHILIGGVDEISPQFLSMFQKAGIAKSQEGAIDFHRPDSEGVPLSEGAHFFLLSTQKTAHSYAEFVDVSVFNELAGSEENAVINFLAKNNRNRSDIDIVFLGFNADSRQQDYFQRFADLFPDTAQAYYQHIAGSYDTASAYGFKLATEVLKYQEYPHAIQYNPIKPNQIKTILLINQANGTDYSFVLLQAC